MPLAVFIPAQLNDLSVDVSVGSPAQGALLYRGASQWNALAPQTLGQVLTCGGAAANPSWVTLPTSFSGDVTLSPGTLARNTITSTGNFTGLSVQLAAGQTDAMQRWNDATATVARVASAGQYQIGRSGNFDTRNALEVEVDSTTAALEVALYQYNATIPQDNTHWSGVYVGAGMGTRIGQGYAEYGALNAAGALVPLLQFQRTAAVYSICRLMNADVSLASAGAALQLTRTDLGIVAALQLKSTNDLLVSNQYNGAQTTGIIFRADSTSGFQSWEMGSNNEVLRLLGTGALNQSPQFATTNSVGDAYLMDVYSTGTPAAGFGEALRFRGQSSTSNHRSMGVVNVQWVTATDATRAARLSLLASDSGGDREGMRIEGTGTAAAIGFLGAAAVVRQTVTGSKAANAALTSLMSALSSLGLVIDSTT